MTAPARPTSSRLPLLIGAGLLVALIVIGLVAGNDSSGGSGPPLSPSSTADDGTRGLVLLLKDLGADTRVGQRTPDRDTHFALLLHDGLDDDSRAALESWVNNGNTLVLTDPDSVLSADAVGFPEAGRLDRGDCDLPALDDVNELSIRFGVDLRVRRGTSCFGDGERAFVVRTPRGRGAV